MSDQSFVNPQSWLAFELNILRRLKFDTAILPSGGESKLGANLKRWNARVCTNHLLQSDWTRARAEVENNTATLSPDGVYIILEDVYVPRHRLQNPALQKWFGEIDACWFDNVRQNIEKLSDSAARALALKIGMETGDYALSFDKETSELRLPLSKVFQKFAALETQPFDNRQKNVCVNKSVNDFIAENSADLMFLRLSRPRRLPLKESLGQTAWREEWIRASADFWNDLEKSHAGKFGSRTQTKTDYLQSIENVLQTASHIPQWALAFVEDGFLSTQEIVETINRVRRVETIFSKDFSELTGTRVSIITA